MNRKSNKALAATKRKEEVQHPSEEKYRSILQSIEEGYYEVDLAGNFTFFNDSMVGILGYSKDELMGLNNRRYMSEETSKKVYQTFNEVYRTGIPAKAFDWELIRKDGTRRYLEISVSLARDSKGRPIGFYGIGRDVTERKRAEEALKASEEKYRSILQSIEEGYYEVDLAGNFTFFNNFLVKSLGYRREELMGLNNRQFMSPETAKLVFETFNEVYRTGNPKRDFQWDLIHKDGTRMFVEVSVSLMRNERGEPKGFYGTARDITERKKEEEALKEWERKYRMTLQNLDVEYFEVDLKGNFTFFTDIFCRILGYSKEELMGMNNRQYQTEETAKKVYQVYNEVYRTGKPSKLFDWEVIRKDGTKRVVETSQCLMQDSRGQPIGFCGIGRDVTERRLSEEQARLHEQQMMQVSKMVALGTLVSGVAHEINNPNNFIMLNTPLLLEAWESSKPILEEYFEKNGDFLIGGMPYTEMRGNIPVLFSGILDGSKRIKQIIEDLRDFIRRDGSDMTQWFDVNGVIRSAISLLSNILMKATTHFFVEYGDSLPPLKGNFQRFEQVIINLIQNACQALPNTQRGIFLSTSYDEKRGCVIVKLQDEGVGIPADVLPHIEEPFFTTKHDFGSLGLGLSISSRIVKEHGGTLNFTSEKGKGTTAEIVLPIPKTKKVLTGRIKT
jgi:PAS domain S-box-containing protein